MTVNIRHLNAKRIIFQNLETPQSDSRKWKSKMTKYPPPWHNYSCEHIAHCNDLFLWERDFMVWMRKYSMMNTRVVLEVAEIWADVSWQVSALCAFIRFSFHTLPGGTLACQMSSLVCWLQFHPQTWLQWSMICMCWYVCLFYAALVQSFTNIQYACVL